jgi:hypothetical protein
MSAPEPFMEHPTGKFKNAIEAMEDAVRRLRALSKWENWMTFCAQGENPIRPDAIQFAEIRLLGNRLDAGGKPLNCALVCQKAGLKNSALILSEGQYLISLESSKDVAVLLDAIFREDFGIHPFADQGNDYAIGAEW